MEFLLLNEVLKNWIFFQMPIKKRDFITLIFTVDVAMPKHEHVHVLAT